MSIGDMYDATEPLMSRAIDMISDVNQFHIHINVYPYSTHKSDRCALIREEHDELQAELELPIAAQSRTRIVGEGIDLIYTVVGAMIERGVTPKQFAEAWREVHRANMDKEPAGTPAGKPTKPAGWTAPNIERALEQ